jgi:hypothetical protein
VRCIHTVFFACHRVLKKDGTTNVNPQKPGKKYCSCKKEKSKETEAPNLEYASNDGISEM